MLNTTTYLPKLKEFEGSIPYMYLDTTSNVTVGVGNMLPSAAEAQKLAFQMRADTTAKPPIMAARAATADEIKADFDNVTKQTAGKVASYYKQFTKCDLPETDIDTLLLARVNEFKVGLIAQFPDYNLYQEEVCAALFDMGFNLGLGKLGSGFPTFSKAVKDKDWAKAATNCHRIGPSDARNDWTKAQFDKADADAKAAAAAAAKK
jgi:GH24 family phage-related lysozyme (muramidase)